VFQVRRDWSLEQRLPQQMNKSALQIYIEIIM
jgi:hypothetical protein